MTNAELAAKIKASIDAILAANPDPVVVAPAPATAAGGWRTGYVASWKPTPASLAPLTHAVLAFAAPTPAGALTGLEPSARAAFVNQVHARGLKALVSIGGEGTYAAFRGALQSSLAALVASVGALLAEGFDGIDVDFEPFSAAADAPLVSAFVRALRAAFPRAILTAATIEQPATWAALAPLLDQVNLMTYDLAGPWDGAASVSWHQAALYDGGNVIAGSPVYSVDSAIKRFAAVPQAKLGLGLSLNGTRWSGCTGPMQRAAGSVLTQGLPKVDPAGSLYDPGAHAAYLSDRTSVTFTSFDAPPQIVEKVAYAKAHGLGGVMAWDLASGTPAQVAALA